MTRRTMAIALMVGLLAAAAVSAGTGYFMKCQAKPDKNPATGKTAQPCGYEAQVTFGGGMFFDQELCQQENNSDSPCIVRDIISDGDHKLYTGTLQYDMESGRWTIVYLEVIPITGLDQ